MTSRHEPRLTRIDDFRREGFEPLHNNTRQEFVKGVAEANGPKLVNQFRVGHFRNKDQVCVPQEGGIVSCSKMSWIT